MSERRPNNDRSRVKAGRNVPFETRYPNIAAWVQDAWVEIGHDDCGRAFVRALDIGGLAWEGKRRYRTFDEALRALDKGIGDWLEQNQ
jgi:hypothetical protein